MIRAVVFDLDDTLYPEVDFVYSGFRAASEWLRQERAVDGFFAAAKQIFDAGARGNVFDQALSAVGLTAEKDLVGQLVRAYREHYPAISLHADARWALERYQGEKRLGLLTDGYLLTQQRKVAGLGIAPFFQAIAYSDAFGRQHWKPSPVPYQRVMKELACDGPECVYVADNPLKDFVAAKRLGWRTVQIVRPGSEYSGVEADELHRAGHAISSLHELERLLS